MKTIVTLAITILFSLSINAQQKHETWLEASQKKKTTITTHHQQKEKIDKSNKCKTFVSYLASGLQVDTAICQVSDSNGTLVNDMMELIMYDVNGNISEEYEYYWDSTAWVYGYKNTYSYDSSERLIEEASYYWDGSAWVEDSYYSFSYDSNGNETLFISYYYWTGSNWTYGDKDSTVYNSNNLPTEEYSFNWDTLTMSWIESYKTVNTYNSNNLLAESLGYYWDGASWSESYKYTYTYDSNGNATEEIYYYWDGFNWYGSYKYTYSYDSNANIIENISYYWDGSSWVESYKSEYTYDANNNETSGSSYYWDGQAWINSSLDSTVYDSNGNILESTYHYDWVDTTATWNYGGKETYTYDSNGNLTGGISYNWNGASWDSTDKHQVVYSGNGIEYYMYYWDSVSTTWVLMQYCTANYNPFAGISEVINNASVSLYPNPMNTEAILNIADFNGKSVSLLLYDNQGKQVRKLNIHSTATVISKASLSSGIYFYQLMGEQKTIATGKLVIN